MRHTDHQHLSRLTPLNPTPLKRALSALVGTLSLLMLLCAPSVRPLQAKLLKVAGYYIEVVGTLKGGESYHLQGELLSVNQEGLYLLQKKKTFGVEERCPILIPRESLHAVKIFNASKITQRNGSVWLDVGLLAALSISNGLWLIFTLPTAILAGYGEYKLQESLVHKSIDPKDSSLEDYTRFPSNYTYEGYSDCASLEEGLVSFKPVPTLPSDALSLRGVNRRFQLRLGGTFQYWERKYYDDELIMNEQSSYGVNAQLIMHITQRLSVGLGLGYMTPREFGERSRYGDEFRTIQGGFESNFLIERVLYQGESLELLAQVSARITPYEESFSYNDELDSRVDNDLVINGSLGVRFSFGSTTQVLMGGVNTSDNNTGGELSWQLEF